MRQEVEKMVLVENRGLRAVGKSCGAFFCYNSSDLDQGSVLI